MGSSSVCKNPSCCIVPLLQLGLLGVLKLTDIDNSRLKVCGRGGQGPPFSGEAGFPVEILDTVCREGIFQNETKQHRGHQKVDSPPSERNF